MSNTGVQSIPSPPEILPMGQHMGYGRTFGYCLEFYTVRASMTNLDNSLIKKHNNSARAFLRSPSPHQHPTLQPTTLWVEHQLGGCEAPRVSHAPRGVRVLTGTGGLRAEARQQRLGRPLPRLRASIHRIHRTPDPPRGSSKEAAKLLESMGHIGSKAWWTILHERCSTI